MASSKGGLNTLTDFIEIYFMEIIFIVAWQNNKIRNEEYIITFIVTYNRKVRLGNNHKPFIK